MVTLCCVPGQLLISIKLTSAALVVFVGLQGVNVYCVDPFGVWGLTSASSITFIMVLILTVLFFFTIPSSQSHDHIQHGHRCSCKFGYQYSLVSAAIVTPPVRLFDVPFPSSNSCIASFSCYYPTLPQSESHADVNKGNHMCASSAEETSSRSSKSSSSSESRSYHVNQPGMWLQRKSKANGGHGSGQPRERRHPRVRCWWRLSCVFATSSRTDTYPHERHEVSLEGLHLPIPVSAKSMTCQDSQHSRKGRAKRQGE